MACNGRRGRHARSRGDASPDPHDPGPFKIRQFLPKRATGAVPTECNRSLASSTYVARSVDRTYSTITPTRRSTWCPRNAARGHPGPEGAKSPRALFADDLHPEDDE